MWRQQGDTLQTPSTPQNLRSRTAEALMADLSPPSALPRQASSPPEQVAPPAPQGMPQAQADAPAGWQANPVAQTQAAAASQLPSDLERPNLLSSSSHVQVREQGMDLPTGTLCQVLTNRCFEQGGGASPLLPCLIYPSHPTLPCHMLHSKPVCAAAACVWCLLIYDCRVAWFVHQCHGPLLHYFSGHLGFVWLQHKLQTHQASARM